MITHHIGSKKPHIKVVAVMMFKSCMFVRMHYANK